MIYVKLNENGVRNSKKVSIFFSDLKKKFRLGVILLGLARYRKHTYSFFASYEFPEPLNEYVEFWSNFACKLLAILV